MESWFIFIVTSNFLWAIGATMDKSLMNKYDAVKTNGIKMFMDGCILLIIGLLFLNFSLDATTLWWSILAGMLFGLSGIAYFMAMKLHDASEAVPFTTSLQIIIVFVASLYLFNETATLFNFIGVMLILTGIYAILSKNKVQLPKADIGMMYMIIVVIVFSAHVLLVKAVLSNIEPINIIVPMYFVASLFTFVFWIFHRKFRSHKVQETPDLTKVLIAAVFGATGTLFLYMALAAGEASKVFSISGIESVFLFIIAYIFLKEKFYWSRFLGIAFVFLGIYLVSI